MTSLASQTQSCYSSASTKSKVSVTKRPVAATYPSIDSALKASIPSSTLSTDSIWTLGRALDSTIDLNRSLPADCQHPESALQERPISYLAPLPIFPVVKRYHHARNLSSRVPPEVEPSTSPMPSPPLSAMGNINPTRRHKAEPSRYSADSTRNDQRPPIPERNSSLDFRRRQQQQQELEKIYLTTHPSLPDNAPARHPHIIDGAKISWPPPHGIGFADMVVTVLHNNGPASLASFLDLQNPRFNFWYERGALKRFYIERSKKFVTIGFVQAERKKKPEEGLTYRIVAEAEGAWEPLCAMGKVNGLFLGPREIDAYVRKVFVVRVMREMGWIHEGRSGSKFTEGEM